MKIQQPATTSPLLTRMREAHAAEVADATPPIAQGTAAPRAAVAGAARDAASVAPAPPVARAILGVAREVIQGHITSPDAARGAVIDAIVEHQYGHLLEGDTATVNMVKLSLLDDPQLQREVDDMLIHAARDLARPR